MAKVAEDESWGQECRDLSRNCETLWRRALSRGCLSKALNDKDILYSHLKAVSGWQLGRSNLFPGEADGAAPLEPARPAKPARPSLRAGRWGSGRDAVGTTSSWDNALRASTVANWEEVERKFQPDLQSPVILEDLSGPPRAVEDAAPALFTLHELLSYVRSPDWSHNIRLRVVGGDLLKTLTFSLLSLERRRLVNLHSLHALANNRVKASVQGEEDANLETAGEGAKILAQVTEEATKKEKTKTKNQIQALDTDSENRAPVAEAEHHPKAANPTRTILAGQETTEKKMELPAPYQTDGKFDYELLSIELIFYDKNLRSNIPYIVPDLTSFDYADDLPVPKYLPRNLVREPYLHREYRIDRIRYPAHENFDMKKYIAQLEQEVAELKQKKIQMEEEAKAQALMEKSKGSTKDKPKEREEQKEPDQSRGSLRNIPGLEFIADDPFLEPEVHTPVSKKTVEKKHPEQTEAPAAPGPRRVSRLPSVKAEDVKLLSSTATAQGSDKSSAATSSGSHKGDKASAESGGSAQSLMNVSGSGSAGLGSLVSVSEPEVHSNLADANYVTQRLCLTNQELYVSSLYAGREENRLTTEEKLEERRRRRAEERAKITEKNLQAAVGRAKGDLYRSFKHLARKKEAERRRSSAPKVKHLRWSEISQRASEKSSLSVKTAHFDVPNSLLLHRTKLHRKAENTPLKPILNKEFKESQLQGSPLSNAFGKPLPDIKSHQAYNESGRKSKGSMKFSAKLKEDKQIGWEFYRREEDRSEMECALNNELERGVLQRMPTRDFYPNYKKDDSSKAKNKPDRNKSQNKKDDINNNPRKSFGSYDLYVSAYGRAVKVTESGIRDSIVRESFCVDKNGFPLDNNVRPAVRRIGFPNPQQLIKYLVSVRNSIENNNLHIAWHPLRSGEINDHCNPKKPSPLSLNATNNRGSNPGLQTPRQAKHCNPKKPSPLPLDTTNNSGSNPGRQKPRQAKPDPQSHVRDTSRSGSILEKHLAGKESSIPVRNTSAVSECYRHTGGGANSRRKRLVSKEVGVSNRNTSAASGTHLSRGESSARVDEASDGPEAELDMQSVDGDAEDEHHSEALHRSQSDLQQLDQDLQTYLTAYCCDECEGQLALLAPLKPNNTALTDVYGCPPILGRMRRDFRFLQTNRDSVKGRLDGGGRVKLPDRPPVLDVIQVGEHLLQLMDDVMVRREILSSSRGFTYTTVTFTRHGTQHDALA
ncbi:hypothetical protein ElyMa_002992100 [Elysia marginata]|uniref:Uncharacterized protein n=1 Tax=Elysia marginata TaxID=1093978 RepID=A0AAV4IBB1_9GAST|nr:hypothetical protein ElyMa_002992100 [Elysia marginata]